MMRANGNTPAPIGPGAATDPLLETPKALPLAGLEWLADRGGLAPSMASPLAFLRSSRSCTQEQRARAWSRFVEAGLPLADATDRGAREVVRKSLDVLERPAARLRIGISEPGRLPVMRQFFVRGGLAVQGFADDESLYLDAPLRLSSLVGALKTRLSSDELDHDMEALCLLPQLFELASALWNERGKAACETLQESDLVGLLPAGSGEPGRVHGLLEAMAQAGILELRAGCIRLTPCYRRWLEQVWSGHILEVERSELRDVADEVAPERLVFAGPQGRRVLCEDVLGDGGIGSSQDSLMLFSRLGRGELDERLESILRPGTVRAVPETFWSSPGATTAVH